MSDEDRLEKMQQQLDRIQHDVRQLSNRLEKAVLQAADQGDVMAQAIKAGSAGSVLMNLIAHFEAAGKPE